MRKRVDPQAKLSIARHEYIMEYDPTLLGAYGTPPADDDFVEELMKSSLMERAGLSRRSRSKSSEAECTYSGVAMQPKTSCLRCCASRSRRGRLRRAHRAGPSRGSIAGADRAGADSPCRSCRAIATSTAVNGGDRPNIVFLMSEDQCTYSMGCYGNRDVRTPNLDQLARDGIVFEKHDVTTAICMASRASLMKQMVEYRTGCNFEQGPLPSQSWALFVSRTFAKVWIRSRLCR